MSTLPIASGERPNLHRLLVDDQLQPVVVALRELRLEELRKFVAVGIEQADRGELAPLDVDATLARVRSRKAKVREES